jgi:hypothetical protein
MSMEPKRVVTASTSDVTSADFVRSPLKRLGLDASGVQGGHDLLGAVAALHVVDGDARPSRPEGLRARASESSAATSDQSHTLHRATSKPLWPA